VTEYNIRHAVLIVEKCSFKFHNHQERAEDQEESVFRYLGSGPCSATNSAPDSVAVK
jgi:hypothetical protein